ncbi:Hydroxyproline O-arabinosyltransferase NOD3-like protein [Drosera capensis]
MPTKLYQPISCPVFIFFVGFRFWYCPFATFPSRASVDGNPAADVYSTDPVVGMPRKAKVMYYWYKKYRDAPGSDMGGYTRVLHSGKEYSWMKEIPTFVVDPLPNGLDPGYIGLNRPWAFVQWLEKATIEEEYILMGQPDHIFVNPLPNLAHGNYPAGFPFFYIKPADNEKIIRKHYPAEMGPITNVDP